MSLKKNVAQKWAVFAWTIATGVGKTGDAANITAAVRIDGGAANAVDDANPAELTLGYYVFDVTAAETNGDNIVMIPASTTAGVQVIGCPMATWTEQATYTVANQLDVNVYGWNGTAVHTPALAGVPYVDVHNWNGTAVSAPATAGIVEVNVKNMNNVAATSITAINANQGTTQPVNFTGTGATAYVKDDVIDWNGTAVHTPALAGVPYVDVHNWNGTAVSAPSTAGIVECNVKNIANAAVSVSTAQLGVNVVNIGGTAQTANDNGADINDILLDTGTDGVVVAAASKSGYALTTTPPTKAEIQAEMEENGASILDTLRDDLADGGRLDLLIDAIKVPTDKLVFTVANRVDANALQVGDKTGYALTTAPLTAAETQSECNDALVAYDPPTKTEMDTAIDALPTAAEVKTAMEAAGSDLALIMAKTANLPGAVPKNVALANFTFLMTLSATHAPATGKTITSTISLDGAAFGATNNAVAEIGSGAYKLSLTQAEMNADIIALLFTETDCDTRLITIKTDA